MRTTIDIPDKQRALLMAEAARRHLRGYSKLIQEAIDYYLKELQKRNRDKKKILKLEGVWAEEDPQKILEGIKSAWVGWNVK